MFPLGCGIRRSEKLEILQNRDVQQVVEADSLPEAYIYNAPKQMKGIDRPEIEIEVPDFIALAEEILEQELEAERLAEAERIRILNKTPVPVLNSSQQRKKQKALLKK